MAWKFENQGQSSKTRAKASSYGGHGEQLTLVDCWNADTGISNLTSYVTCESQQDLQRDVRMYKISWISDNKLDSKVFIATPDVMLEDIPSSKEGKSRSQCQ
jgi:hypothetical protein